MDMEINEKRLIEVEEAELVERSRGRATGIILYGEAEARKGLKEGESEIGVLSEEQVQWLNLRAHGLTSKQACSLLGTDNSLPLFWEAGGNSGDLFHCCLAGVKRIEADNLEDDIWQKAIIGTGGSEERRFALKGRKPEYKDSYQGGGDVVTQLKVTINGEEFDTSARFKPGVKGYSEEESSESAEDGMEER